MQYDSKYFRIRPTTWPVSNKRPLSLGYRYNMAAINDPLPPSWSDISQKQGPFTAMLPCIALVSGHRLNLRIFASVYKHRHQ